MLLTAIPDTHNNTEVKTIGAAVLDNMLWPLFFTQPNFWLGSFLLPQGTLRQLIPPHITYTGPKDAFKLLKTYPTLSTSNLCLYDGDLQTTSGSNSAGVLSNATLAARATASTRSEGCIARCSNALDAQTHLGQVQIEDGEEDLDQPCICVVDTIVLAIGGSSNIVDTSRGHASTSANPGLCSAIKRDKT